MMSTGMHNLLVLHCIIWALFCQAAFGSDGSKESLAQAGGTAGRNTADYRKVISLSTLTTAQIDHVNQFYDEGTRRLSAGTPLPEVRQEFFTRVRSILNKTQRAELDGASVTNPPRSSSSPSVGETDNGSFTVIQNVSYVTPGDSQRVGDVYLPKSEGLRPAVLYIHGGGWSGGDKRQSDPMVAALASHGFVVFNINYRLVGQGGEYPANLVDVKDALAFLGSQSQWHVNPNKLAAMGGSAGAHLAMLLGYTANGPVFSACFPKSKARVVAVVSWFGPTDLSPGHPMVDRYLSQSGSYREASPVDHAATAVPTLFVHGTADSLVPIAASETMAAALQARHIPGELVRIEGAGHGFPPEGWSKALDRTIKFLDSQFATTTRQGP